jgi:hypothetical protein
MLPSSAHRFSQGADGAWCERRGCGTAACLAARAAARRRARARVAHTHFYRRAHRGPCLATAASRARGHHAAWHSRRVPLERGVRRRGRAARGGVGAVHPDAAATGAVWGGAHSGGLRRGGGGTGAERGHAPRDSASRLQRARMRGRARARRGRAGRQPQPQDAESGLLRRGGGGRGARGPRGLAHTLERQVRAPSQRAPSLFLSLTRARRRGLCPPPPGT